MVEVKYVETPFGKKPICKKCGSNLIWHECENCEDGFVGHECGEDVCCYLDPLPNVKCDECRGDGGWWVCLECEKEMRQ